MFICVYLWFTILLRVLRDKIVQRAHQLDTAKAAHRQEIDDAKKALLHTIDQRVNAATDAGDLGLVTSLQAVQATAAVDATVPDDVKDSAVLAAKGNYDAAIKAANTRLNLAYQKAVRDFTRAREIAQAQSTQAEMNTLGLVDPTAPSAMTVGTYQLASRLPSFLMAKNSIFVPLGDRLGIVVPETQYVRTREGDLLSKNFTADFWFYMIQGMHGYPKLPAALVGLGEGTANPVHGGPLDALYLEINPPDQNGGEINLHRRLTSEKTTIGHLKEFDTYVVRIQKSGDSVTFIVGTEQSGTLVPTVSVTVDDVRNDSPYLNEQNTHLFFGSGAFEKLSIGKGPPPTKAEVGAKPLVNAGEGKNAVDTPAATVAPGSAAAPEKPAAAQSGKPFAPRTINLLALCDPKRDAVKGSWRMEDGELIVKSGNGPQLNFPYKPPAEYDYCVDFTRGDCKELTTLICPHGAHVVYWDMAGRNGKGSSFDQMEESLEQKARIPFRTENNHRYKCKVEVRDDRLRAFIDGHLVLEYLTNYEDFIDPPNFVEQTSHLGLLDWFSTVHYHKVEVIERSGPGTYFPPDGDETHTIPAKAIEAAP